MNVTGAWLLITGLVCTYAATERIVDDWWRRYQLRQLPAPDPSTRVA